MKRKIPKAAWEAPESETREMLTSGQYPAGVVVVTEFEDQTYWGWGGRTAASTTTSAAPPDAG